MPFLWWLLQLLVTAAIGSVIWTQIDEHGPFGERLFIGLLMSAPLNFVIFGFSMIFWVPWMKTDRERIQEATITGRVLRVISPREMTINLEEGYAAEVGRDGERWSVRLLFDDEEPLTLVVESERAELKDEHIGKFIEPEHWSGEGRVSFRGTLLFRRAFGDALLEALRATAGVNRFATWDETLARYQMETASAPFAVTLAPDAPDEGGVPYRVGRPSPEQPSFGGWVRREGLSLLPGVTLTMEYLVVDTDDGHRVAFPLGATEARDEVGSLSLVSMDEAGKPVEARVAIADRGLCAALSRRVNDVSSPV